MIVSGSYEGFASCDRQHRHDSIMVALWWNSADPAAIRGGLLLGGNAGHGAYAFTRDVDFDFEVARDMVGATVSQAYTRRPIGTPGFIELALIRRELYVKYPMGSFIVDRRDVERFLNSTYEYCPTRTHESDAYDLDRLAARLQYSAEV